MEDGMTTKLEIRRAATALRFRFHAISALATLLTIMMTSGLLGQQTEQAGKAEAERAARLASRDAPIELYVRNNHFLDARVYAVRSGIRYRVGTVTSFTTEKLELPRYVGVDLEGIQLLVLPIGSNASYLTETINAFPGDALALEVEQHLPLSAFYRAY